MTLDNVSVGADRALTADGKGLDMMLGVVLPLFQVGSAADQNDGLLSGAIDLAWNSPLAWIDAQRRSGNGCRAIAMRDTDRDRVSYFVAVETERFFAPTSS